MIWNPTIYGALNKCIIKYKADKPSFPMICPLWLPGTSLFNSRYCFIIRVMVYLLQMRKV